MNNMLTLALSKGRIFDETMPLLKAAGIEVLEDPEKSRKLILPTNHANVRVVLVRASDVPTYVQYGGADLGVTGLDTLIEHGGGVAGGVATAGLYQQHAKFRHVPLRDGRQRADRIGFGRHADFGAGFNGHHTKRCLCFHAGADHIDIAGLKDAQGQDAVGKQNGIKREKCDPLFFCCSHACSI